MARDTILITGARGYLGGRLLQHFAERGKTVIGTSRSGRAAPNGWNSTIPLKQLDPMGDPKLVRDVVGEASCVIHLSAANEILSTADPDKALLDTGAGTRRLLEACVGVGVKRFVFLSTVHVYGAPLAGQLAEDSLPTPVHPYAISHMVGEAYTLAANATGSIQGTVVRLSNGIGAPAWLDVDRWTLVGNDLARQAVEKGVISIKSPQQWRDFITLNDVCRGLELLCCQRPGSDSSGIFNLASGVSLRIGDLAGITASIAERLLGSPIKVCSPSIGESGEALQAPFKISISKIKGLGFIPSNEEALEIEMANLIKLVVSGLTERDSSRDRRK